MKIIGADGFEVPPEQAGYLRSGAPVARCSACGRQTVDLSRFGQPCGMTQPDATRCTGVFSDPRA